LASELVRELVDAGIHFGHRASRWNPKMAPYIFGKRNMIHVIDIRETVKGLIRAKKFIAKVVAENGDVLVVGTKRQARHAVEMYAKQAKMPYVTERWLGGTLTNFETIRSRLARLEDLEREEADGTLQQYSKKRIARDNRERRKIARNLDGIRTMSRLPKALVIIDVHREHIAVREARKLGIPTVCLIDTDSDPDFADIPIPGNDDSMRSIEVLMKHVVAAVEMGRRGRVAEPEDDGGAAAGRRRSRRAVTGAADGPATGAETATMAPDAPQGASPDSSTAQAPPGPVVSERSS
jgi:small subunit ribosomal protein S2